MNKGITFLFLLLILFCSCNRETRIIIDNLSSLSRIDEIVEVDLNQLPCSLLIQKRSVALFNEDNIEIPYQVTYDRKFIFPASVVAFGKSTYTIRKCIPKNNVPYVGGRLYPERLDDIAWENDISAYRVYGPALQHKGEHNYGYDIWTKSVPDLVVEKRYRMELDSVSLYKIDSLRKNGLREKADSLVREISYHVDHGDGMDCYNVGPTLGAGTAALMLDSVLLYPYCFEEYEILDNGPLRFTVCLKFPAVSYDKLGDVREERLISLDKGSLLNYTEVYYKYLQCPLPIAVGIVIHPQNPNGYYCNKEKGIIAYVDSTNSTTSGNGVIYIGAVVTSPLSEASISLFDEKGQKMQQGALGHVLAIGNYSPGQRYTYFWGGCWSKRCKFTPESWLEELNKFRIKIDTPVNIKIE